MARASLANRLATITASVAILLFMPAVVVAESVSERILREGKIVIGIANGAPWGYRDEDGEAAGFHPDLIEAAFSGFGVDDVEIIITEFGALIPALLAQRFDAIAAGLYITPERCELVAFSDPDLKLADAALVLAGNPKQVHGYAEIATNPDVVFGVGRGSTTAANAAAAGVPKERTLLFPDIQSTVGALLTARIDVAAFSAPTVARILSDKNISGIDRALPFRGVAGDDGKERFGYSAIAFRKEDTELRDLYNTRLHQLQADGGLAAIMGKHGFSDQETVPPRLTSSQICEGHG
jgi:polar amino acid transport system substrate-binding protein